MKTPLRCKRYLKTWVLCCATIAYCAPLRALPATYETMRTEVQQTGRVTGRITDAKGMPLPGASVKVIDRQISTSADVDGKFILNVPAGSHVLEVSFISFASERRTITVKEGQTLNLSFILKEESNSLNEVVVVGYGRQKKANLTGAVDQVDAEELQNRPIPNVSQGLVGVIPNLNIRMLDGKPTQSPSFNVRGTTSIGQGGNALVLIDNVEGDPRMLNPNDIESISVLKDAASASIYGARAAFGVVLITTKSAKEGKTAINYSTNYSWKSPTTVPDNITESYPWAQGFSDAWSRWNDNGNTPTAVNKTLPFSKDYLAEIKRRWEDPSLPRVEINPANNEYRYYYSTDWYKELYKDNFVSKEHNLSLSGGNDKAAFYLSGRYNGQDGLFRYNSDTYEMYNLRGKGSIELSKWLRIENNTEYAYMDYHQPLNVGEGSGIWRNIADEGHPLAPLLNPDGTLSFSAAYTVGDYYLGRSGVDNSQRFLKNRTAVTADFFDKSLTLRADFTFQSTDIGSQQNRVQVPYSRYQGVIGYTGTNTNDIQERRRTTEYLATNVYADYIKSINNTHNFKFLAGFNYEQSLYRNLTAQRNGILYWGADDINLALGQSVSTTGGNQKWAIAGGFFRVNYNFKERYLLELNGRYDGSSKFPTDEQWAFFPSVSAGWRLSEEPFWGVNRKILSDVKLRVSYGSLGNGNIDPYSFTENFKITQSERIINGVRPQRTSQPAIIPIGLTWETSTTGNIGLDFSSLDGKLQFVGDAYRRWTSDMFTVGPTVPAVFGTGVPKGNFADMETTGWEISVNWNDRFSLAKKPFNYGIRVTMSDYIAEITKYNNADKKLSDYYEGQRVGEIWGYQVEGLFRSADEIANSPSQANIPNTNTRKNYVGDLKFRNLDGDNVIFEGLNQVGNSGDKTIIGNSEPRYTYGFNLSGDWSGFFVSAFFQGVLKQDYYPAAESRFWGQYNRPYNSYPRWHEDNMFREELGNFDAYLPRLVGYVAQGTGRALQVANDRFLQDASYIRLRNLQVGYSLPKRLAAKLYASDVRLYVSAENLWTWSPMYKWTKDTDVTNIYGSDRDLSGGGSGDGYNYPMLKAISLGLNVNF
ncbi:TonB-linked SusC/RagA family outer membrane protein [Arcticibacter tournemirensis]|uniref:TonB-dependent receptor n=1 Tax=Arcticibacter tournemirensis TaxID=699437 RepID=A0A5M9HBK0_9SPHI|nr:TonB-dependent receptor [Arcticibacter tournemirensis]KAA8484070.1 TonB-dependent receptor [Arcticibacter tournemirensis]TQM51804.1 TonB-linked SusC/RagA family outer membrane protein [Arcticibacter tournemirensis]